MCIFCGLCERIRNKSGIFALVNLKNQSLCLYKKFPAGIVGANPGKFTRQKPKRKPKAAPHTRPDTVKSPQQTKINREFPQSPKFPYLCGVFLPIVSPNYGILTAPPGFVRAGFCLISERKGTTQRVFPDSLATIRNRGRGNARCPGRIPNGKEYFPGIIAYYPFSLFGRPAHNTGTGVDVLFCRNPFQIFHAVVRLVFVFVVNLRQPVRIRNKCQRNQPIYAVFLYLSILAQLRQQITVFCPVEFQDFAPTDAARCANLVRSIVTGNIGPNFVVHNTKIIPGFGYHTRTRGLRQTCV